MGLDNSPFTHYRVRRALLATDKTVIHVIVPATIVTLDMLRRIIYAVSDLPEYVTLRFLFVTMFMSMLRQSNFAPQNMKGIDHSRQLTRGDVKPLKHGLKISIEWEKNLQKFNN